MRVHEWLAVASCLAVGCGRIGFEDLSTLTDDALTSRCSPWSPATRFPSVVQALELANGAIEQQPHLSSDGLTIYFTSARSGDFEIYAAERGAATERFMNIHPLAEVNSPMFETAFAPAIDQLTAYLASNRAGESDLYISQRSSTTQAFGAPALSPASTAFIDYDPFLSADGLRLYWSIRDWDQGIGGTDLVVATRTSTSGNFGPPTLLSGLSTALDDDNPSETADGRMLVFSSSRDSIEAIYYATRATKTDAYSQANLIGEIRISGVLDDEPYVTPDGCELWFTSTRQDGNREIFVSRVTP